MAMTPSPSDPLFHYRTPSLGSNGLVISYMDSYHFLSNKNRRKTTHPNTSLQRPVFFVPRAAWVPFSGVSSGKSLELNGGGPRHKSPIDLPSLVVFGHPKSPLRL